MRRLKLWITSNMSDTPKHLVWTRFQENMVNKQRSQMKEYIDQQSKEYKWWRRYLHKSHLGIRYKQTRLEQSWHNFQRSMEGK